MEKQITKANKMNDSHLSRVAQAYVNHEYVMSSKRSWQILARSARSVGALEVAEMAKRSARN